MTEPSISVHQAAANRLKAVGVSVLRVHDVRPPTDTGDHMTIRFIGRHKGDRVSKRLTAYLPDLSGAEPILADGWGS